MYWLIRILVKKTKTHYQMSNLAFITILNNLKGNFKQRQQAEGRKTKMKI